MRTIIRHRRTMHTTRHTFSHHYHPLVHRKCIMKTSMTHKVITSKRTAEALDEVAAVVAIFSFQTSICRANNATVIQMTIRIVFSMHRMIKIFHFRKMAPKYTISIQIKNKSQASLSRSKFDKLLIRWK